MLERERERQRERQRDRLRGTKKSERFKRSIYVCDEWGEPERPQNKKQNKKTHIFLHNNKTKNDSTVPPSLGSVR